MSNFKLTITPALEKTSYSAVFTYETAEQMVAAKDTAANLLLFLQEKINVMPE